MLTLATLELVCLFGLLVSGLVFSLGFLVKPEEYANRTLAAIFETYYPYSFVSLIAFLTGTICLGALLALGIIL